ncbi:glutathione S-transferase family protein [Thalassospira marina]|uniref:Glutathione S-transferase n=1 Tax=Thalassospira marina TaxID=2048283 RepID=A0ABN5FJ03_9PROT|nr:glutathione S-transferase N-terminal domain-containing protein [Thalassospira marina]AUG54695.1 glutathione S-transferase [Thalassospira marina]
MRLFFSFTSPFARKVRICLRELGLAGTVDEILINPWTDEKLRAINPLAKVPTLVSNDGQVIFESGVICDFLDEEARSHGKIDRRLFPIAGPSRWRALQLQALADGIMTATGRLFADQQRPENERSDFVMNRQADAVTAGLAALNDQIDILNADLPGIGEISVASALEYLAFRWPDEKQFPLPANLAAWRETIGQRPAMVETRFYLPK